MLDVKKLLTNILNFKVEYVTSSQFNISGSSASDLQINIAKTGYVPIGILGLETGGLGSSYLFPYRFRVSGNIAYVSVRNSTSTARSNMTVSVNVLYIMGGVVKKLLSAFIPERGWAVC